MKNVKLVLKITIYRRRTLQIGKIDFLLFERTCEEGEGHDGTANNGTASTHAQYVVVLEQLARLLEGMGAVVAGEVAQRRNHHLAQRRVNVEEEGAVDVPVAHLPKVGLVPAHPGGLHHLGKDKNN